jgi:hypothetical protein
MYGVFNEMQAKVISEYIRCVVCNFEIQRLYLLEISIVINKRKKKPNLHVKKYRWFMESAV